MRGWCARRGAGCDDEVACAWAARATVVAIGIRTTALWDSITGDHHGPERRAGGNGRGNRRGRTRRRQWTGRARGCGASVRRRRACADVVLRALHRLMGRASGSEPVARIRETTVPVPLQHLHYGLLDEAVEHRGDAERTNAARHLRDLHAPYQLRCVAAVEKPGPDLRPVVLQVIAQVIDGHTVDAGRPFVAPDHAPAPSSSCQARPPSPSTVPAQPPGVRGRHAPCGLRFLGLRRSGLHPSPPAPRPVPTGYSAA